MTRSYSTGGPLGGGFISDEGDRGFSLSPGVYVSGVPEPAGATATSQTLTVSVGQVTVGLPPVFGDIIQSNGGTGSASSSFSPTLPGAITAGSLVVIMVVANNVPSGANTGWTKSTGMSEVAFAQGLLWWFVGAGSDTVPTITFTGSTAFAWRLVEYAGSFEASPYDESAGAATNGSITSITSSSITPTPTQDYLLVAGLGAQCGDGDWDVPSVTLGSFTNSFTNASQQFRQAAISEGQLACQVSRVVTGASGSYSTTGTPSLNSGHGGSCKLGMTIAFRKAGWTAPSTTPPAYRSHSSVSYASRSSTVLTAPSGLADDDILIAVIAIGHSGSDPGPSTPPAGFTAVTSSTWVQASGFYVNFCVYWKRAASESGSYTFTHSTDTTEGVMLAYSGCLTSGSPIDSGISTQDGAGSTSTLSSITTTVANTMLLAVGHNWDAAGASPPTGFTERFDHLVTVFDDDQEIAGASGTKTINPNGTTSGNWQAWLFALLPVPSGSSPDADVDVTTNLLTVSVDQVTVTGKANVSPTTNTATVSVDQATVQAKATASPTTNLLTTSVDQATVTGKANVSPTTNLLTASVDQATVSTKATASPTTNLLTTSVDQVTVTGKANVSPTTNVATITVDQVTVQAKANVSPTTNLLTTTVDQATVTAGGSVSVNLADQALTISVDQVTVSATTVVDVDVDVASQTLTASVDAVVASGAANVTTTTNLLTTSVSGATVQARASVTVEGQVVTSFVDQASVSGKATTNVTTNLLTASVDAATATAGTAANTTTNLLTIAVPGVTVTGEANVYPTTNVLSVSVGQVTVEDDGGIVIPVYARRKQMLLNPPRMMGN